MTHILLIETATKVCSVGLARNGEIISIKEDHSMQYSHSSLLTSFMEEVVQSAGIDFKDLDAVAVSKGPGSYTGLRIGVSAAKGLCYALDIPLISVNTLQAMAYMAAGETGDDVSFYVPMIDARRMEVYNAVFDPSLNPIRETMAEIIDEGSLDRFLHQGRVVVFGDGAAKCHEILKHPNAAFYGDIHPSVKGMLVPAREKFGHKEFEDIAYFEPFYLKDFVAGKPKVKGLQ